MKPTQCIVNKLMRATDEETAICIAQAIDLIGDGKIKSGEEYAFLLNVVNAKCNKEGLDELYAVFKRDRKKRELTQDTKIKNAVKKFTAYAEKRGMSDDEIANVLKTIIKGE